MLQFLGMSHRGKGEVVPFQGHMCVATYVSLPSIIIGSLFLCEILKFEFGFCVGKCCFCEKNLSLGISFDGVIATPLCFFFALLFFLLCLIKHSQFLGLALFTVGEF